MAIRQPVVFPLFGILPNGQCACGNDACKRIGKHPAVAWGELVFGDPVPRPEPGAGVGLKTGAHPRGSGVFVVDLDSEEAADAFDALGGPGCDYQATTYSVQTARGWHLYFQHPGFPVRNSAGDLGKGIDIRGDGGFVVAAGSPHRSGTSYKVACENLDVAPAPDWLLDWLRARPAPAAVTQPEADDVTDPDERAYRRELYTKYLRTEATPRGPAIRGKGDATLFEVVQRGAYDLQLPTADVLELIREHYDPRCSPMWGDELDERVHHKARDAKASSTRPRAEPLPRDVAELVLMPPDPAIALRDLPRTSRRPRPAKPKGIVWGGWEEPVPPPEYLVQGLIPVETVGMFVAMGSSLKTWTALDIARCVSKGAPWLDRYPTRTGKALVVDYESGLYELRRRIHLLEGGAIATLGAWCYPEGYRIDAPEFWREIAKIDGLELVVIDSLAAGAPGVDENDTNVAMPLKLAARFTEGTGASALFIHHSRKDDSDDRKMVRGSTAIYADCDWAYRFDPVEETKAYKRMYMACIKPCMGPKPDPVHLELTQSGQLVWFDDSADSPKAKAAEDTPEAIQAAIKLALEKEEAIETKAKVAAAVGRRLDKVVRELDALVVRKEVVLVPGTGYALDGPAERVSRIRAIVAGYAYWRTPAQLAKAASVSAADIEAAIREGHIARSAEGRFIVTQRGENS